MSRLPTPIANVVMAQIVKPIRKLRIRFIFVPHFFQNRGSDGDVAASRTARATTTLIAQRPLTTSSPCFLPALPAISALSSQGDGERVHDVQAMYQRTSGERQDGCAQNVHRAWHCCRIVLAQR